jgi:uncharacterized ferritin-like protein (DUF455 family)
MLYSKRPRARTIPEVQSVTEPENLTSIARNLLLCGDAEEKACLTRKYAAAWKSGTLVEIGMPCAPDFPARPVHPQLLAPRDMPRRRAGGKVQNRTALLHAVAHIELNAINLAWDIICRFASDDLPRSFIDDWVQVVDEEAKHFLLISGRLKELGTLYGALPAHDGLWQAAGVTAHSLLARLAIVPLVFEARGLDVTPRMIEQFKGAGDARSAACLDVIYREEIGHVAIGKKWFDWQCDQESLEYVSTWQALVREYFAGELKPPFNDDARQQANLTKVYDLMETDPVIE